MYGLVDKLRYCDGMTDEEIDGYLEAVCLKEPPIDKEECPF